jgi:hypothetical protein
VIPLRPDLARIWREAPSMERERRGPGVDPGPFTWANVAGTPNGIRTRVATLRVAFCARIGDLRWS